MARALAIAAVVVAAMALPAGARGAAGFTEPVQVSARGPGCPALAGGRIGWSEYLGSATGFPLERATILARVASLSAPDTSAPGTSAPGTSASARETPPVEAALANETTIGGARGTSDCPTLAASGGAEAAASEAIAPPPPSVFDLISGGALWLEQAGGPAVPAGITGLDPQLALAPGGEGVFAWLHYEGERSARASGEQTGPAFALQAARLSPNGALGAPQLLAGPGAGDEHGDSITGPAYILAPVDYADPGGELVVASALIAPAGAGSTVQVSEAPPGQSFGAPQTLLAPSTSHEPVSVLRLAGNARGEHLLQWQRAQEPTIETFLQASPSAPFQKLAPVLATGVIQSQQLLVRGLALDEAGESFDLLGGETGGIGPVHTSLLVLRRPPGAPTPEPQYLVRPSQREGIADPQLAVAPDGAAAVVWVAARIGPDGGETFQAMLATAPPGGPFGAPAPLSGLAPVAIATAVAYDAAGSLRVAWTTSTAEEDFSDRRVYALVEAPGAPDPLLAPGPRVSLRIGPRQRTQTGLFVTVRVDRPCLVRIESIFHGLSSNSAVKGGLSRADASHHFAAAGSARLHIAAVEVEHLRHGHGTATVVAYATSPSGASSVAGEHVAVIAEQPRFAITRRSGAGAHRADRLDIVS
jgi:hypothetical protein